MLSPFAIFSEERMRLGIAKFEKQVFPFASALTFHYLCIINQRANSMRIISGKYGRRRFDVPTNIKARPTTDFARENIFNVLENLIDFEGIEALDLFAGTGQLGIETLSRGARSAVFVDESRAAVQLVRANLALCRLQGDVVQGESLGYLRTCGKFDLIFLDPPYDTGLLDKALENVVQFDILAEGGIIVCESRREKVLPQLRAPYHLLTERNYGKIKLTLYGKGIHA